VGDHPPGETSAEVIARVRRNAPAVVDAEFRRRAGLSWLEYAILIVLSAEHDHGVTVPQLAIRLRVSSQTARRLTRNLLVRGDLLPTGAGGLLTVSGDLTFITGATFVGLQGCELRVRGSGRSDLRTKSRVVGSDLEAYVRTVSGPERCRSCMPPGAGPVVLADAVAG
jgi:hypothetical protein